ncbi:hypothetical protein WMY93_020921 [Mugilogobius chulae]|uniref:Serine/threonine-protein phosphatase PGAM5, mitochondrial n=1 Tax=Mugilogobius chulae TaxID=88201 RepID=A0AAW0NDI0_9GOBI
MKRSLGRAEQRCMPGLVERTLKLLCGLAGGSAVIVVAAAAAESRGCFGGGQPRDGTSVWSRFTVIKAAQPAWTPSTHTPAPSGHSWDFNWDKRDPSALVNGKKKEKQSVTEDPSSEQENNKPKATRNILLIRHSQYNLSGVTDKERFLTPLGREQAELTGQRLAALGLKYDLLIHSSMSRATETASIISKHLPGVDLQYHEDGARIEAAFRRYIHRAEPSQKEDSYEIIVCHANVIRYFVCRALQFPPEGWLRMGLNNGSITWLTIRPSGRVALRTLGDSGFMPPDKLTRT